MARHPHSGHLLLDLDNGESTLVGRFSSAFISAIAEGRLADGDLLPATRTLAAELKVSRSVIVAAYEELIAAGLLVAKPGSGTRVEIGAQRAVSAGGHWRKAPPERPVLIEVPRQEATLYNLIPGFPDTTLMNRRDWNRATRAAASQLLSGEGREPEFAIGRTYDFGRQLCVELTQHLRRNRGILCDPRDVFIFPGVNAAVRLVGDVIFRRGSQIGFEDPGYPSVRRTLGAMGMKISPVPVDKDGLVLDEVPAGTDGIYVTPAHQFPLGARLSVRRRTELLRWACEHDKLILEDDYDGEFRYDAPPMPALRGMPDGPERVVYFGTCSKTIARDLRLSWAVVPARFRQALMERLFDQGDSVSLFAASAMTCFLRSGGFRRHIASIQRIYADRRAAFIKASAALNKHFQVAGISAGLHVVLVARDAGFNDQAVVRWLGRRGLQCTALSTYYLASTGSVQLRGLVCGYSRLPAGQAESAIALISAVIK